MSIKLFNKSYVMEIVEKVFDELKSKGIPFESSIGQNGVGYLDKGTVKEGSKHKINILVECDLRKLDYEQIRKIFGGEEEEKFSEEEIMEIVSVIFHEYRHLEQTENYKYHPDFSQASKTIATMNAIQLSGLADYYLNNYRNDLKEIDAIKYSIEEAVKFIKSNFPEIDAEKGMLQSLQTYIQEDKNDPKGFHMFDEDKSETLSDIITQLQERMSNTTRVDLNVIRNCPISDLQLKQALTDELVERYNNCSNVEEKDAMILGEILKIYPEILQEYPVLQEERELNHIENRGNGEMESKTLLEEKKNDLIKKKNELLKRNYQKKSGIDETIGLEEIIEQLKTKGLFNEILDNDKIIKNDSLQYDSELHGANHTRRVAFNTTVIAMMEGESSHNIELARTIANYHDIGRIHDYEDEQHGEDSVKILKENPDILENLSSEDRDILSFVIKGHSLSKRKNDEDLEKLGIEDRAKYKRMLDIVKDADKLDRVRIDPRGIYPREGLDVSRLSLDSSKKLENFSYESFDKVLEYMDIENEIRGIEEELLKLNSSEKNQEMEKSGIRKIKGKKLETPDKLREYFWELRENGINAYILEVSDGNKYIVIKNETSDDVLIEYKDKEEYVREKLLLNSYLSKNDDKRAEVTGSGEKVLLNLEENRCILLGIDDIKINGNDIIPIREAAKKLIEKETVKDKKGKKVVDFKNIGEKTVLQNHLLEYLYGKRINLSPDAMQAIKYYKNEKGEIDYRDINVFLRGEFSENHFNVEYVKNVVKSIIYLSKIAESMPVRKYDIMIGRKGNGKGGARNANNIGDKNNYDSFVSFGTNTGIALSCFSCMSYNRVLKSNDAAIPIGMLMKQMERCIR